MTEVEDIMMATRLIIHVPVFEECWAKTRGDGEVRGAVQRYYNQYYGAVVKREVRKIADGQVQITATAEIPGFGVIERVELEAGRVLLAKEGNPYMYEIEDVKNVRVYSYAPITEGDLELFNPPTLELITTGFHITGPNIDERITASRENMAVHIYGEGVDILFGGVYRPFGFGGPQHVAYDGEIDEKETPWVEQYYPIAKRWISWKGITWGHRPVTKGSYIIHKSYERVEFTLNGKTPIYVDNKRDKELVRNWHVGAGHMVLSTKSKNYVLDMGFLGEPVVVMKYKERASTPLGQMRVRTDSSDGYAVAYSLEKDLFVLLKKLDYEWYYRKEGDMTIVGGSVPAIMVGMPKGCKISELLEIDEFGLKMAVEGAFELRVGESAFRNYLRKVWIKRDDNLVYAGMVADRIFLDEDYSIKFVFEDSVEDVREQFQSMGFEVREMDKYNYGHDKQGFPLPGKGRPLDFRRKYDDWLATTRTWKIDDKKEEEHEQGAEL